MGARGERIGVSGWGWLGLQWGLSNRDWGAVFHIHVRSSVRQVAAARRDVAAAAAVMVSRTSGGRSAGDAPAAHDRCLWHSKTLYRGCIY